MTKSEAAYEQRPGHNQLSKLHDSSQGTHSVLVHTAEACMAHDKVVVDDDDDDDDDDEEEEEEEEEEEYEGWAKYHARGPLKIAASPKKVAKTSNVVKYRRTDTPKANSALFGVPTNGYSLVGLARSPGGARTKLLCDVFIVSPSSIEIWFVGVVWSESGHEPSRRHFRWRIAIVGTSSRHVIVIVVVVDDVVVLDVIVIVIDTTKNVGMIEQTCARLCQPVI
eukprot:scaffold470_cov194-Amphora_coffeaeformis.AAC.5